jgi:hypothetical protein
MSTTNRWLRRIALVLALAPLAAATLAAPAHADDHHRRGDYHRGHDRDRGRGYGGGYYAPPPPVYYAPQPRPSPGISLFFPIR